MRFEEKLVVMPNHDCDVVLEFPGGDRVVIQARPSNADVDYNGSLDFILPGNQGVTCWVGDDLEPAPQLNPGKARQHERIAKQLAMELPGLYEVEE